MEDVFEELQCVSLELLRYQDMTQQLLNYIGKHAGVKEVQDMFCIIQEWCC